jgi:5-deoxy-glucuronate isomerase
MSGRSDVFSSVTDAAYVPRDSEMRISSVHGARIALPQARARRRIDSYYIDAREVPIEKRGSGRSTRQLNNFLAPEMFEADRLVAVEVVTPRGNWSSYPPHKHDVEVSSDGGDHPYAEAELEEIYWFRTSGGKDGFGIHRTYDLEQQWDITVAVRDDDVFLVPRGYHGPCIAAPEYDLWYLNVLAGPGEHRSLAFSDDARYAWVRDSWNSQELDSRVPLYTNTDGGRS